MPNVKGCPRVCLAFGKRPWQKNPGCPQFNGLYRNGAFEVECGPAGNLDAFAGVLAKQLTTPFRDLKSMKLTLAQNACPVGYQHAMR